MTILILFDQIHQINESVIYLFYINLDFRRQVLCFANICLGGLGMCFNTPEISVKGMYFHYLTLCLLVFSGEIRA
jgi:hypothetical protein